jgi:hypothetical protein
MRARRQFRGSDPDPAGYSPGEARAADTECGKTYIRPMPAEAEPYIRQLAEQRWVKEAFRIFGYGDCEFKLVEIDPLLIYNFVVDTDRSAAHTLAFGEPTIAELLPLCLPRIQPKPADLAPIIDGPPRQPQSLIIKSKNLALQQLLAGVLSLNQNGYETWVAGMQLHVTLPFVHVVRFNGRCYLSNGTHRAFGLRRRGVTHMPCLFREAGTPQEAGMVEGATFPLPLLECHDPPTVGHFTQGRAHEVLLRAISRIIHVSWSQFVEPDE